MHPIISRLLVPLLPFTLLLATHLNATDERFDLPPPPPPPLDWEHASESARETHREAFKQWESSLSSDQRKIFEENRVFFLSEYYTRIPTKKDASFNWKDMAPTFQLSDAQIEQLEQDSLSFGTRDYKQSFEIYNGNGPFFITTDSILNGFHFLFEQELKSLEYRQSEQVKRKLLNIWNLSGIDFRLATDEVDQAQEGFAYLKRAIGPALFILGAKLEFNSPELKADVMAEVRKIEAAQDQAMPQWMGIPEPAFMGIDYSRFKPVGFHTKNPELARYFKAIRWLQSVPFRDSRQHELAAAHIFQESLGSRPLIDTAFIFPKSPDTLSDFNVGSLNYYHSMESGPDKDRFRDLLFTNNSWATDPFVISIFNRDRLRSNDPQPGMDAFMFRMISPMHLPEDWIITDLINRTNRQPRLDYLIGTMLRSNWVQKQEQAPQKLIHSFSSEWISNHHLSSIPKALLSENHSLYQDYLETLACLFDKPLPGSPDFMNSEKWQRKSLNTSLAPWAQMRHSLSLLTSEYAFYLGLVNPPAGYIEPNPEFYSRLADLAEKSYQGFLENGSERPEIKHCSGLFKSAKRILENSPLLEQGKDSGWPFDSEEVDDHAYEDYDLMERTLELLKDQGIYDRENTSAYDMSADDWQYLHQKLEEVIHTFQQGRIPLGLEHYVEGLFADYETSPWVSFISTCRRLEAMSYKQLQGIPWNARDEAFIKTYGQSLARFMGYYGNSWLDPNDNSPRIASILNNPASGKHHYAATGRPREIFVLYPYQGHQVLCRGAILPYYELNTSDTLDDESWQALLDSDTPPQQPDWWEE